MRTDYHYQMSPWISSALAIAIVSGIPLVVTLLLARHDRAVRHLMPHLTAFGAGALFGAATIHLIPEALSSGRAPLAVFAGVTAGYIAFALVEKLLASHDHAHAHGLELGAPSSHNSDLIATHGHADEHDHDHDHAGAHRAKAMVPLAFAGDAIHNLVDGMLIAAGFLTDPTFGFLTAIAIGLHELPREVGTFGLFVHGGVHPMRAVLYNLVTAAVSFIGAAITLVVGEQVTRLGENILPFAAGSYLYIAVAVGIPAIVQTRGQSARLRRSLFMVGGLVLMSLSAIH